MISLEQMLKVPQLYQEVAHAARTRASGTANAAEEADSIRRLSEWQGASGEAADDANRRTVSTFEHSAVSDTEFAARAESAAQSATKNAQDIRAMLDKADAYPAVHVDLHTNEVKPADMTNMNKGSIDRAWQKYAEIKQEVERIVAAGNATDLEFARAFVAGTGGSEDAVTSLAHDNGTATRKVFEAPPAGRLDGTGYWQIDKTKPMDSPDSPPPPRANYTQEMPQNEYTEGVKSAPLVIGKNWAEGGEEPYAQAKEQFQFRVSGTEFTGQTKMVQVDGKWYQAEWQNYTYDMKRTSIIAGGNDMGGLGSMPVYRNWEPVSYGQIMGYSAAHPDGPLFLPDTCGNQIKLVNAAPVDIKMTNGQFTNVPIPQHGIPEMRSGR
ncbi:Uncharacterised protein [Mycobacteroides abscessus subsp. abscessus]|uniref:hypothetical protein n=1 Tax=Mycobacteroides abscessus TaxID=36809 RepID=UPI00092AA683|nr:hypothetical protein [Mycobacteroides abscessus]SIM07824.1 Uncharacterised protein [Mycobacteroides abscessus subsp. abscessus]